MDFDYFRFNVEIAFQDKHLRDVCENEEIALQHYSLATVQFLKSRLSDLRAAEIIAEVIAVTPTIDGDRLILDLCPNFRIIFLANHTSNPIDKNGIVDWTRILRIKAICIEEIT